MMPCEPLVASPPAKPMAALSPAGPLPPPRPLCPDDVTLEEPVVVTLPAAVPVAKPLAVVPAAAEEPAPRKVSTIRFIDESPMPPANATPIILAVIRRSGATTARVSEVRAAVEHVCHGRAVDCQAEVAGEKQLRVTLTVGSAADWADLYERLEQLPDIGEYGLLFEVHVKR